MIIVFISAVTEQLAAIITAMVIIAVLANAHLLPANITQMIAIQILAFGKSTAYIAGMVIVCIRALA